MHRATKYVGVLTTDANLIITSWDPWLAEATGRREEDVRGRVLQELFPEIEQRGMLPKLRRVLEDGTVAVMAPAFHQYLIHCAAPGAQPHFNEMQQHVTISPLRESGVVSGLVITIEDVTARCVRERELAAQLKNQDEAIRIRAARILSQETADATPLLGVMDDANWQVRQAAVAGVSRTADADVVQRLVEAVRDHHDDISLLNSALSALTLSRADALPYLLPLLDHELPNVRLYTALALGNMQDARAAEPLSHLLDDPDANVRYHAIEALGRIRARESAFALLPILESRDPFLSFAALDALGAIGERSVAPVVIGLLEDDGLAASAVDALSALGDEKAAAALARMLGTDRVNAASVSRALSSIYRRFEEEYGEGALIGDVVRAEVSPEVVVRLVSHMPGASDDELVAIARVLGWLDFAGVDDALAGLLAHPRARRIAADALVKRGVASTAALTKETRSDDADVRKAAALALGRIGDRAAAPALMTLLHDGRADVIITAAGALGSIGERSAFDDLLSLLSHDDASVRHAAVSAINSIGHPETAVRVRDLLHSGDERVREAAVRIAGYFGYAESFDAVLDLLSDPVESVRRAAVEHLGYFDDERVLPALAAAIRGNSASVRAVAARALAHVEEQAAEPHLRDAINDPDPRVRYQAVQAAMAQRLTEVIPTLRKLAKHDPAIPVRIAATTALGEFGDAGAASLLAELALHPELDIASAAIRGLGKLSSANATVALERALFSTDTARRRVALDAVSEEHLPRLLPHIEKLAASVEDRDGAARAIRLLAQSDDDRAFDVLLDLAADTERRADVITALAGVEEKHVGRVARGLRHRDASVRSATVEALARMKRASASRMLGGALQDNDPAVRFATAQALGRLDLTTHSARAR